MASRIKALETRQYETLSAQESLRAGRQRIEPEVVTSPEGVSWRCGDGAYVSEIRTGSDGRVKTINCVPIWEID
ncbi:MAG: hypothetical protein Q7T23_16495 [Phenylobacterium sp.]|nr:hypothetical protein [Phenylobacterium sp.]